MPMFVRRGRCVSCKDDVALTRSGKCLKCSLKIQDYKVCERCLPLTHNVCRSCKVEFAPYGEYCKRCELTNEFDLSARYGTDRCLECLSIVEGTNSRGLCVDCFIKAHTSKCKTCFSLVDKGDSHCFVCAGNAIKCADLKCEKVFIQTSPSHIYCEKHSPKCISCSKPTTTSLPSFCDECLEKETGLCSVCGSHASLTEGKCINCADKR